MVHRMGIISMKRDVVFFVRLRRTKNTTGPIY